MTSAVPLLVLLKKVPFLFQNQLSRCISILVCCTVFQNQFSQVYFYLGMLYSISKPIVQVYFYLGMLYSISKSLFQVYFYLGMLYSISKPIVQVYFYLGMLYSIYLSSGPFLHCHGWPYEDRNYACEDVSFAFSLDIFNYQHLINIIQRFINLSSATIGIGKKQSL